MLPGAANHAPCAGCHAKEFANSSHQICTVCHTDAQAGKVKPFPRLRFGAAGDRAFGTPGAGGSFGFADPETGVGYCYAPNRLGFGLIDPRETALRDALYRRVLGERPQTQPRFSRAHRA